MPLDYLSELKESCAIDKSRSLTVTRATKNTEWKSALSQRNAPFFEKSLHQKQLRDNHEGSLFYKLKYAEILKYFSNFLVIFQSRPTSLGKFKRLKKSTVGK